MTAPCAAHDQDGRRIAKQLRHRNCNPPVQYAEDEQYTYQTGPEPEPELFTRAQSEPLPVRGEWSGKEEEEKTSVPVAVSAQEITQQKIVDPVHTPAVAVPDVPDSPSVGSTVPDSISGTSPDGTPPSPQDIDLGYGGAGAGGAPAIPFPPFDPSVGCPFPESPQDEDEDANAPTWAPASPRYEPHSPRAASASPEPAPSVPFSLPASPAPLSPRLELAAVSPGSERSVGPAEVESPCPKRMFVDLTGDDEDGDGGDDEVKKVQSGMKRKRSASVEVEVEQPRAGDEGVKSGGEVDGEEERGAKRARLEGEVDGDEGMSEEQGVEEVIEEEKEGDDEDEEAEEEQEENADDEQWIKDHVCPCCSSYPLRKPWGEVGEEQGQCEECGGDEDEDEDGDEEDGERAELQWGAGGWWWYKNGKRIEPWDGRGYNFDGGSDAEEEEEESDEEGDGQVENGEELGSKENPIELE